MSFRRGGAKKRRDTNEKEIIQALRNAGAECWQVSGLGLPDLLVRFRGRYYVGEVKTADGKATKHQGAFPIWRDHRDALCSIGAIEC